MNDAGRSGARRKSDWPQLRTACCWIGGGLLLLGGLTTATSSAGWANDIVTGVIEMLVSPIFVPPVLRRLRVRLPALRQAWAPFLLWIATGPVAVIAGLPFIPSAARQAQLKFEAVADAKGLLAAGFPSQARIRLNKFAGLRHTDPAVAALFAKIAAAEQMRHPVAKTTASALPPPAAPSATPPNTAPAVVDNSKVDALAYLTTMKALQDKMNDPSSLLIVGNTIEHVVDGTGKPILKSYVKYRGTNSYGGTVTEAAVLTITPDGKTVLSMEDATTAL